MKHTQADILDLLNDAEHAENQAEHGPYYMDNPEHKNHRPERILCATEEQRQQAKEELLMYAKACREKANRMQAGTTGQQ